MNQEWMWGYISNGAWTQIYNEFALMKNMFHFWEFLFLAASITTNIIFRIIGWVEVCS